MTHPSAHCTCGAAEGIDAASLIVHARVNGKFGRAPQPVSLAVAPATIERGAGWCEKCESYCYGDCTE
jgi:hypothetical protein